MKLRIVPALGLIFSVCSFFAYAQDEARVTSTWQVQKYDINATLPQSDADRNMVVHATLALRNISGSPASTLSLRISPNAEISAVNINGSAADFSKREEKVGSGGTLQRIVMRVPPVPANGTLTVAVDYKLAVKDNSGLASISPVSAHFLPLSFWYPTPNSWMFSGGADSAPFTVAVTGGQNEVITSGERRSKDSVYEEKSSGQPFFVAGNWDAITAGGVSVYAPKGSGAEAQKRAAELASLLTDARSFVAPLLGPAPEIPLRIVAVKRGSGFSGGGTILVDESIFRRQKIDSLTAMNIAEAAAKIWLGNAIGVTGNGYGAISQGLVRHIATQFIESKYGKEVADVERARQRAAYAAIVRRDAPITVVSPVDDFYFPEVANKGAMVWNLLQRRVGKDEFYKTIRENAKDGRLDLAELRDAFSGQKDFLDYMFDHVTDTNLLVGLPQAASGETRVALRNAGGVDVTVKVAAETVTGERLSADSTIRSQSFGEVSFKTGAKIQRVEIDTEKLYPQTDYSDDVAPREFTDSDVLLAVKRSFDQQDFATAEKNARTVLREMPRFDDVRTLLGRSLLSQNKASEAEKEFRAVLDEKLPTARSMAWADVGLADISGRAGQTAQAVQFAEAAINTDGEYGASLAARSIRSKYSTSSPIDESIKAYFSQFDKTAIANKKADLDAMVVAGEATKFANGISGQTEQWQTQVKQVDRIDANSVLVETNLTVKLLNRDVETGMAVYRLTKVGGSWKLGGVEMFEVR